MKNLSIVLGIIFSLQAFSADTNLLCNDQNSRATFRLKLSSDLMTTKLIAVIRDSSILSAGSRELKQQEGESSEELSTYAGKTNSNLHLALLFNSQKALVLMPYEILEVTTFFQQRQGDILSGKTLLLCSKN